MTELLNYLNNGGSIIELITLIIIIVAVFYYFEKIVKTVKGYLNGYVEKKKKEDKTAKIIESNKESIDTMTARMNSFENNFIDLMKALDKDMQVIHRKEIREIYEKAKANNGVISEKDMRDYHYALECYINHNGNSYVQDEIVPYMKTVREED